MFITLDTLEIVIAHGNVINVPPISLTPFIPYLHLAGLQEWQVEIVKYNISKSTQTAQRVQTFLA